MAGSEWTLEVYRKLCRAILSSDYRAQPVREYLRQPGPRAAILRHDVDRFPRNALRMARVEHEIGLRSTYYVRLVRGVFDPEVVTAIDALGHEVGYHYETLAKARGDMAAALHLFEREVATLRELVPIHTAAAHGSPLSRWNNLDIWSGARPAQFGLVGEAYADIDYTRVAYFTDTGRAWDATSSNLRDRAGDGAGGFPRVHTTDRLIGLIEGGECPALCIQTHPERWNETLVGRARSLALDVGANGAKRVLRQMRAAR